LKFLFLNQYGPPDPSPTARILAELADFLRARGDSVTIVSYQQEYHGRPPRGVRRLLREVRSLLFIFRRALSVEQRPDIVLALSSPPCLLPLGRVIASRYKVPLAHWAMDLYPELAHNLGELKSGLIYRLLTRIMEWGYRGAQLVVALDEDMASHLRRSYAIAPVVLPPWPAKSILISQQKIASPTPVAARPLTSDAPFVWTWLYSGNLGRAHEWEPLLDIQYELERRRLPIRLLFQGGGAMWPAAQARAKALGLDRCVWNGYVPEAESFATLQASALVIVTQRREAQGLLWPSKLSRIIPLNKPLLWVGPIKGAIARSLTTRPFTGCFEPETTMITADWIEQLFLRTNSGRWTQYSTAEAAAIYGREVDRSCAVLAGWLYELAK
jgi:colanic acid biosynthesis glycosyl transferase WcaI